MFQCSVQLNLGLSTNFCLNLTIQRLFLPNFLLFHFSVNHVPAPPPGPQITRSRARVASHCPRGRAAPGTFIPAQPGPRYLNNNIFYLFSSEHFVPTILPTNIYKLCILNENEIHNRQSVIWNIQIFQAFQKKIVTNVTSVGGGSPTK